MPNNSYPIQMGTKGEALRARLHADILAAWPNITKIYDDSAEVPDDSSDLPYAAISLPDVTFGSEVAGIGDFAATWQVEITFRGKKPTSGLLRIAKLDKADALLARLTASPRYAGNAFVWEEENITVALNRSADMREAEAQAIWFEVTIKMVFEG